MVPRKEIIGNAELWLGDCFEILPTLPRPDAIVCDPPYGQGLSTKVRNVRIVRRRGQPAKIIMAPPATRMPRRYPHGILGDSLEAPFDVAALLPYSDRVLLWGAHKFAHKLPQGRWLAWDKVPTGKVRDQGDGEMAWTNVCPTAATRFFRLLWDGICVGSPARHEVTAGQSRVHPTQKPQALMAWCLQFVEAPDGGIILDPCMGAGSTGLAALDAGYRFIGIEIEPFYFDIACRRIEDAQRQQRILP